MGLAEGDVALRHIDGANLARNSHTRNGSMKKSLHLLRHLRSEWRGRKVFLAGRYAHLECLARLIAPEACLSGAGTTDRVIPRIFLMLVLTYAFPARLLPSPPHFK